MRIAAKTNRTTETTIDVVSGTDKIRKQIESGVSLNEIESGWKDGLDAFEQLREKYLLY